MNPDWTFRWKDAPHGIALETLEALHEAFLLEFFEAALPAHRDNPELLSELGEIYTRRGRLDEGLELDLQLARLRPDDPTVLYNLACSLALTGQAAKALKALESAVRCGFDDFGHLRTDEDLASLRHDPAFQALLGLGEKAPS